MDLIVRILGAVFGGSRNVVAETAEVFRVNAEAEAARSYDLRTAALRQFGQEFKLVRRGVFDRMMDGVNRVPRPAMALGTMGLFVSAMVDPVWFAARMAGIALVPEPLWWLLGAIVSFYFGGRHQAKGQAFRRELAATMAAVPQVVETVRSVQALSEPSFDTVGAAPDDFPGDFPAKFSDNRALDDWHSRQP